MLRDRSDGWSLIDLRVREAMAACKERRPGWFSVLALQVAAEQYVEICWQDASLGPMRRSQSPHSDLLQAAETLALAGFVPGDLPILVKDLQRLARNRYGMNELDRASVEFLINRLEAVIEKPSVPVMAA